MREENPVFPTRISWPEGIDEQVFLAHYWQKKPLLMRQAFTGFESPLSADELAGLSLEPDSTGRLITQDERGAYHLEHGPFDEERFAKLTDNRWSLLVTDVEKILPDFVACLEPFRFIEDWRIDDLMISYAPDGASVGAHVDEYDVFLLQGSGTRQWQIDADSNATHKLREDGDLKIIESFEPTDVWTLTAGDMLYLPPGVAHHGIAVGDNCTTWSIGFRAPLIPDLISRIAEAISEKTDAVRYRDEALSPARRGEMSSASIEKFKSLWIQATQLSDAEFAQLLGCWLSESPGAPPERDVAVGSDTFLIDSDTTVLHKAAFSRFIWIANPDATATLFVDGVSVPCTLRFAELICTSLQVIEVSVTELPPVDVRALNTLANQGSVFPD